MSYDPTLPSNGTTPGVDANRGVTVAEAARALGIPEDVIVSQIHAGLVPARQVHTPQGAVYLVPRSVLPPQPVQPVPQSPPGPEIESSAGLSLLREVVSHGRESDLEASVQGIFRSTLRSLEDAHSEIARLERERDAARAEAARRQAAPPGDSSHSHERGGFARIALQTAAVITTLVLIPALVTIILYRVGVLPRYTIASDGFQLKDVTELCIIALLATILVHSWHSDHESKDGSGGEGKRKD